MSMSLTEVRKEHMLNNSEEKKLIKFLREYAFFDDHADAIIYKYNEPHRKYHTLEHIKMMLDLRDMEIQSYTKTKMPSSLGDQNLIQAIVLHDFVYDKAPQPLGINEYYSAKWSEKIGASDEVIQAIMATSFYLCDQRYLSIVAQEICDLDLSNLALEYTDYCYWANLAIEEAKIIYFEGNDPGTMLLWGQANFCNEMLERNAIYYRHPEWEDKARLNLEQKLNELEELLKNDNPG
jgi:predicted metal-dependent HD superfamily phosphohydrolase